MRPSFTLTTEEPLRNWSVETPSTPITYKGRRLRLYDSFEFLYDIVFENFAGGAYDDLDVRDRVVVDVGAGVGDTAILFSLMGAKKVIALEPFPSLYEKALVNVKINSVV
jgi:tRNA/tmRNA/rRNA uracil-C5-methylase (TrmA/RlmC/RlmD family)